MFPFSTYVLVYFEREPQTQVCSFLFIKHSIAERIQTDHCAGKHPLGTQLMMLIMHTHTHTQRHTYIPYFPSFSLYLHFLEKEEKVTLKFD